MWNSYNEMLKNIFKNLQFGWRSDLVKDLHWIIFSYYYFIISKKKVSNHRRSEVLGTAFDRNKGKKPQLILR